MTLESIRIGTVKSLSCDNSAILLRRNRVSVLSDKTIQTADLRPDPHGPFLVEDYVHTPESVERHSYVRDRAVKPEPAEEADVATSSALARRLLSLSDEVLKRGMALATIFEYDSSIFRCKRMQDVAARLVRNGTEEPWNVMITPPVCGMGVLCSPTDALLHSRPRCGMLAHLPLSVDPPMKRGGLAPARANRICEYIDLHLQENIALEVLAGMAQLSAHHFARAFRQSVGVPPNNYIVQRRVEHAQQLLRNTDLPLSEIAIEAGFTDQSHLARHFRTITGVSPSLARHQLRTSHDIHTHHSAYLGS